jgi:predicted SAM-dependent methyltransferase
LEDRDTLDFSNTKIGLHRPISSYSKVQEFISAVTRNRHIFANKKSEGCYLDLGCGPNIDPAFCNLDFRWRPGVDVCWDATRGLPFSDAYVSGIFTEHMLEHVELKLALQILRECRRVLRVGGVLRIVVPDGELYLSEYAKHLAGDAINMPYAEDDKSDFEIVTPMVSINRIFRSHGHKFIWDYETLRMALRDAGFTRVERRAFGVGLDSKLLRDSPIRQVESLYVEAS